MTEFRCASGKHCAAKTRDGSAITGREDTLCHACVEDIQRKLKDLPALIDALKVFIGYRPVSVGAARVKASREPQAPMNLHAYDVVNEVADVYARTGAGAIPVRDLINQPAMKFETGKRDIYLTGVQRALDVRRVWLKSDQIIGLQQTWERRHAPCPDCDQYTLGMWAGSGVVHCTSEDCGRSMPISEYESHCTIQAKRK